MGDPSAHDPAGPARRAQTVDEGSLKIFKPS